MTTSPRPVGHQPPDVPGRPSADHDNARETIRRLRQQGGTYRSIAVAAGLAPATVHDLASGRRASTPTTTRALAKVDGRSLRRARVDASGTRLRLRALHVMGHGSARIARALGVREMTIRAIVRGDAPTVSTRLREAVADLYDVWWDKRAPERGRTERGAATAARRRTERAGRCGDRRLVYRSMMGESGTPSRR
jgi:transcriptional regulator with XRE-family HTH domain